MSVNPDQHDAQVDVITMATGQASVEKMLGFWAHGVIIDNLTNQWLQVVESYAFIAPYISGRQIPLNGTQKVTVKFAAPTGFSSPGSITGQIAVVRFTAAVIPAAPGVPVAPGATRWIINHFPAIGVQASVTKAAAPGVVHVADDVVVTYFNSTAVAANINRCNVIDGPSGGGISLWSANLAITATAGSGEAITNGPQLGTRGTIGSAMTIEFIAGVAGTFETVHLIGYDA